MAETGQQSLIRAYWTDTLGGRLDRNNVGSLPDRRGVPIRFGLANDSAQVNRICKSGDLIGWTPTLITPDMVGNYLPVYTSVEVKHLDWKFPGAGPLKNAKGELTAYGHAVAQRNWADIVRAAGGLAGFMRDPLEGFLEY